MEARGLRRSTRSVTMPPQSLAIAGSPSALPSIQPSAAGPAPRVRRNDGRTAVASSCETSEKRLASAAPSVERFSHPRGVAPEGNPCRPCPSPGDFRGFPRFLDLTQLGDYGFLVGGAAGLGHPASSRPEWFRLGREPGGQSAERPVQPFPRLVDERAGRKRRGSFTRAKSSRRCASRGARERASAMPVAGSRADRARGRDQDGLRDEVDGQVLRVGRLSAEVFCHPGQDVPEPIAGFHQLAWYRRPRLFSCAQDRFADPSPVGVRVVSRSGKAFNELAGSSGQHVRRLIPGVVEESFAGPPGLLQTAFGLEGEPFDRRSLVGRFHPGRLPGGS